MFLSNTHFKAFYAHPTSMGKQKINELGVKFDNELTLQNQINTVVGTCFGLMHTAKKFLQILFSPAKITVILVLTVSRLDYANTPCASLPQYLLRKLQTVQNAAASLVLMLPRRALISSHLKNLHWLRVKMRILLKTLVLMHKALNHSGPEYLSSRIQH